MRGKQWVCVVEQQQFAFEYACKATVCSYQHPNTSYHTGVRFFLSFIFHFCMWLDCLVAWFGQSVVYVMCERIYLYMNMVIGVKKSTRQNTVNSASSHLDRNKKQLVIGLLKVKALVAGEYFNMLKSHMEIYTNYTSN